MITYPDGTEIQAGDSILIEGGTTPGTVYELIETPDEMKQCGVDVPGVMVKSAPFGLIYLPLEILNDDPIVLVSRSKT